MISSHIMMGHKGGIGKSFGCVLLANYIAYKEFPLLCIDTDPQNATLAQYKALPVVQLALLDPATKTVNTRNFDVLFEKELPKVPENGHVIIDIGSGSYTPFLSYLMENPAIQMLESFGSVHIHTVLTGGQAHDETLKCLGDWAERFPNLNYMVWLNLFFGAIAKNNVSYADSDTYKKVKSRVAGLSEIKIPFFNPDTYGEDLERLLSSYMTIGEAQKSEDWGMMAKQRLIGFQRTMFAELDKVHFLEG